MTAITAVTAQNSLGVHDVRELDGEIVRAQLAAVLSDITVDAVKIGMLYNEEIVLAVAEELKKYAARNIVADTVMVSTSGRDLLLPEAVGAFKKEILPLAKVITPNLAEASALTGQEVIDKDSMIRAAKELCELGCKNVVVKGGHLEGDATDILFDGKNVYEFNAPRSKNPHTHGTGCTYSSAIAAGLAKGMSVIEAVNRAKQYISVAIAGGFPIGRGTGSLHHFAAMPNFF
jgi:hydroxymethylpyrimidine/phosphomethylpyrimidine kinase